MSNDDEILVKVEGVSKKFFRSLTCQTRQVADGVAVYLDLFKAGGENIAGSGEVRVTGLELTSGLASASMSNTLTIDHGAALRLCARLQADPVLRSVRLQFLLWNSEMLPVLDFMTEELSGFCFDLPPSREIQVTADLPKLELNAGKYSLSVIALNHAQDRVLSRHDNAAYEQVKAATASGAHVLSPANWGMKVLEPSESLI